MTGMTIEIDLLSSALPHQIAVLDENERYIYVNGAYSELYGIPINQLIGKKYSQVIGEQRYEAYLPSLRNCVLGMSGFVEHTFPNKVEGRKWRTSFVPRPEGGCIVISDDPGDKQWRKAWAQRTEQRLQAFVDFAPIGMIFSHLDGRILEANKAFLDLIGYTRDDLENGLIHWDRLTPQEYLHLDFEAIAEAKETGFSRTYEKEYFTRSGNRVAILVGFILVGPTRDEAVAFVVDITAQKRAEEEVRRLNAELEERVAQRTTDIEAANKELEAFCYSVSHDLRAPLRSIDGFAFALFQDYEDKLDAEGVDFINRIRGSAKRMDELISALLSLSRVTRTEVERENVNASKMAETIAAELRSQQAANPPSITVEPNLTIHGDRRMLQLILDNLIGNAVKFSAKGPEPEITFGRDARSGAYFVRDNGVGFDPGQSDKLFQPFERLHSPREFSGNGIGLATVQRIVRKHGGSIWAEAEVGKGSTFYFTL